MEGIIDILQQVCQTQERILGTLDSILGLGPADACEEERAGLLGQAESLAGAAKTQADYILARILDVQNRLYGSKGVQGAQGFLDANDVSQFDRFIYA